MQKQIKFFIIIAVTCFLFDALFRYKDYLLFSSEERDVAKKIENLKKEDFDNIKFDELFHKNGDIICLAFPYGGFALSEISDYKNYKYKPDTHDDGASAVAIINTNKREIYWYKMKYRLKSQENFVGDKIYYSDYCVYKKDEFKIILDNGLTITN